MTQVIVFQGSQIKVTQEEKETLVKAITQQAPTEAELKLYFYDCDRRGVHPLDKLIHFTKRNGRYAPVISIDYMRIRAESSGAYAGSDDAVFENGEKYPNSATITVWKMVQGRLGRFTATARWSEYAPADIASTSAFMWRKMPHTMLAKCAEALALRKAFPGQLAGLYAAEEMAQDGRYIEAREAIVAEMAQEATENESQAPQLVEDSIDQHYPRVEQGKISTPEVVKSMTKTELLKSMATVREIALKTGKKDSEVAAFIAKFEAEESYTVNQIVGKIKKG